MELTRRSTFVYARRGEGSREEPLRRTEILPPAPLIPSSLADLLPPKVTEAVASAYHRLGGNGLLEEIRLRAMRQASLTVDGRNLMADSILTSAELFTILTDMCGGSLYAYSQNINEGFLTLPGGIRVGVAGEATCEGGRVVGVREIAALCIRIPHGHRDVGKELSELLRRMMREGGSPKGLLLYAPPGVGKTTLLRGVTAHLAGGLSPLRTVVVDTRGELTFPTDGDALCLDILTGYPRALGVGIATRSLGAQVIVCDEIGERREAMSLISAYYGGVPLVATAHGQSVSELLRRPGLMTLHKAELFGAYIGLSRDGHGGFVYDITRWEEADRVI